MSPTGEASVKRRAREKRLFRKICKKRSRFRKIERGAQRSPRTARIRSQRSGSHDPVVRSTAVEQAS
jgi:hypothetical protein